MMDNEIIGSIIHQVEELLTLIDNSSSMNLYDTSFVKNLKKQIGEKVPVKVRTIGNDPLYSDIGDDLIRYLEHDGSILLVSDMQATHGLSMQDAISHSSLLNTSISAINLKTKTKDISVTINGPTKATTTFKPGLRNLANIASISPIRKRLSCIKRFIT